MNIDFALAVLCVCLGLGPGSGEAIFAVARTAGLLAHAIEEYPHRLRFRPRTVYVGLCRASPRRPPPARGRYRRTSTSHAAVATRLTAFVITSGSRSIAMPYASHRLKPISSTMRWPRDTPADVPAERMRRICKIGATDMTTPHAVVATPSRVVDSTRRCLPKRSEPTGTETSPSGQSWRSPRSRFWP